MLIGIFYRDYMSEGGMPLEYKYIVKILDQLGHEIKVYCYINEKKSIKNKNIIQIKRPKNIFKKPKPFYSDLIKNKFDLFFVVSAHLPENIVIIRQLIRQRIKYIYCVGDAFNPILLKKKPILSKLYRFLFEKKMLQKAALIRSYSRTNTVYIKNYYGGELPVFELYEGIHEDSMIKEVPEYNFNNDKINFLYLGRIQYFDKGIDLLLEAFSRLFKNREDVKLHMYGPFHSEFDEKRVLKDLKRFTKDQIEYYGPIYGITKYSIIKSSDVFILPSRHEGIPRSLRESFYLGTPVIVSKNTNVAENVLKYNAGFDCECSVDSIYKSIIDYINYSNKSELAENSKKLSDDVYNWNSIKKNLKIVLDRYQE